MDSPASSFPLSLSSPVLVLLSLGDTVPRFYRTYTCKLTPYVNLFMRINSGSSFLSFRRGSLQIGIHITQLPGRSIICAC